ncbi:MAG: thiamine pyrophosphate-dependent enzyme [Acidimicrobiales bacterium]
MTVSSELSHLPGYLETTPSIALARLVSPEGSEVPAPGLTMPADADIRDLYRRLVVARRFDRQATLLARQGRLAVYPSASGQEACQVGAVAALGPEDWMFPTYRETAALVTRGIPAVEALSLLRGERHCGYDPRRWRTAPQCTPLATQALHAVGLAFAAKLEHDPVAVLTFLGDGATSEGDTGEALNCAAVYGAPVVFFIQNNQYAISVPLAKQTRSPTLAHRALGYAVPGYRVDGNDVVAVKVLLAQLLDMAREGGGPALVEAVTYRMEAHTNSDDPSRYRSPDEMAPWAHLDPVARVEAYLMKQGALDRQSADDIAAGAESFAAAVREALSGDMAVGPQTLFSDVYRRPTPLLEAEAAMVAEELRLAGGGGGGSGAGGAGSP